jgi:phosphoribosylformylglycinamidine synthase PurS subunit
MRVKIFISFKKGVLDPQGKAIEQSLHTLGYREVADVRLGKLIDFRVADGSAEAITNRVHEMCDKLLANPVIEDYRFELVAEPASDGFGGNP